MAQHHPPLACRPASEAEHTPRCRRYSQVPNTFTDRCGRAVFCPYAFRILRGVSRVQVIRLHDAAFEEVAELETTQVDRYVDRLVEISVHAEKGEAFAVLGQHGSADDIGEAFAIACR